MTRVLRIAVPLLLVAIVIAAAIFGPRACSRKPTPVETIRVDDARSAAIAEAAIGAAADTATAMTEAAKIDATTRENDRAIRSTPGAVAPVPVAVNDAGVRALCVRSAYRDHPRCVALFGPRAGAAGR
ncbi:hypothetical protein [uncultured Sphingomonas sp.]|uniref:hypothetical protein n=1 Tax=uncultured Sphingomonas sp. TaxID=158754 RepID=UPI0025DA2625|nr:hypothetical protein [uncultured Sphingomonas sp.]